MPERLVPEQGQDAATRDVQKAGFSQHHLALLLRYAVDKRSVEAVRILFDGNPEGVRSKHVIHNLGKARIQWLREKGFNLDG